MFYKSIINLDKKLFMNIDEVSDEAILREADKRGLHLGVSYRDMTELMVATVAEDWKEVRKLVARMSRDNLGRII